MLLVMTMRFREWHFACILSHEEYKANGVAKIIDALKDLSHLWIFNGVGNGFEGELPIFGGYLYNKTKQSGKTLEKNFLKRHSLKVRLQPAILDGRYFSYELDDDDQVVGPWADYDFKETPAWALLGEGENFHPWQNRVIDISKQHNSFKGDSSNSGIHLVLDPKHLSGKRFVRDYCCFHRLCYFLCESIGKEHYGNLADVSVMNAGLGIKCWMVVVPSRPVCPENEKDQLDMSKFLHLLSSGFLFNGGKRKAETALGYKPLIWVLTRDGLKGLKPDFTWNIDPDTLDMSLES